MDAKQYVRKTFPVYAVQVTLENHEEVAQWCNGTIEMASVKILGTPTPLPAVRIKTQGNETDVLATIGCYVVQMNQSYRVYKPAQFHSSFEASVEEDSEVVGKLNGEPEQLHSVS